MAAYGLDILDVARVSPRRLWVLARNLPPWARSPGEPWGAESGLLAALIDHVAELTWVTLRAAGNQAARPKPIPRPPRLPDGAAAASTGPRRGDGAAGHAAWANAIRALAGMPGVVTRDG